MHLEGKRPCRCRAAPAEAWGRHGWPTAVPVVSSLHAGLYAHPCIQATCIRSFVQHRMCACFRGQIGAGNRTIVVRKRDQMTTHSRRSGSHLQEASTATVPRLTTVRIRYGEPTRGTTVRCVSLSPLKTHIPSHPILLQTCACLRLTLEPPAHSPTDRMHPTPSPRMILKPALTARTVSIEPKQQPSNMTPHCSTPRCISSVPNSFTAQQETAAPSPYRTTYLLPLAPLTKPPGAPSQQDLHCRHPTQAVALVKSLEGLMPAPGCQHAQRLSQDVARTKASTAPLCAARSAPQKRQRATSHLSVDQLSCEPPGPPTQPHGLTAGTPADEAVCHAQQPAAAVRPQPS